MSAASPEDKAQRVNLLNWDAKGAPEGLFPPRPGERTVPDAAAEVSDSRGEVDPKP